MNLHDGIHYYYLLSYFLDKLLNVSKSYFFDLLIMNEFPRYKRNYKLHITNSTIDFLNMRLVIPDSWYCFARLANNEIFVKDFMIKILDIAWKQKAFASLINNEFYVKDFIVTTLSDIFFAKLLNDSKNELFETILLGHDRWKFLTSGWLLQPLKWMNFWL